VDYHQFRQQQSRHPMAPKAAKDFKKETGKDLGKLAKAKDIAQKMLETFPALEKLENLSEAWAYL
jgi:hypothetical protein